MNNTWKGKYGPLLIAEIGGNHEGDFEYAKKLTQLAIESDVDYIKYQIYTGDSLVNPVENPIRNKHFKKFELSKEKYIYLAEMCREANVGFMASIWNPEFVSWVDDFSPIYKIGSGDFTAVPVLDYFIGLKKPLLLSTGLCDMKEVKDIIDYVQNKDNIYKNDEYLGLLQCTSMYPIPNTAANLNVMKSYMSEFNVAVGYSDHTVGSYALEIAVAMGAQILEFHFTDSRENRDFRDHQVSLTRDEVLDLIEKIKVIKDLQGSFDKVPLAIEAEHRISFRRGLYFNKDLSAGHRITKEDLISLRPNHGTDAREYHDVIGKVLKTKKNKFDRCD